MSTLPEQWSESNRPRLRRVQRRVYEILAATKDGDLANRFSSLGLVILIVLNVLAAVMQTVERIHTAWRPWFVGFEVFSVAIFTIEYLLRLWSCTVDPEYRRPIVGRLRFAARPLLLIDLLAIAPFYATGIGGVDLRMLRAIRLLRLLRVLKIARYSESLQLLARVFLAKKAELLCTLCAGAVLLLIASSLIYYLENEGQPDQFGSIPDAMWWSAVTLTTVGYGDVVPKTPLGKVLAAVIAVLGIGLFALPAGILGSGFVEELQRKRNTQSRCPHCGHALIAEDQA